MYLLSINFSSTIVKESIRLFIKFKSFLYKAEPSSEIVIFAINYLNANTKALSIIFCLSKSISYGAEISKF